MSEKPAAGAVGEDAEYGEEGSYGESEEIDIPEGDIIDNSIPVVVPGGAGVEGIGN